MRCISNTCHTRPQYADGVQIRRPGTSSKITVPTLLRLHSDVSGYSGVSGYVGTPSGASVMNNKVDELLIPIFMYDVRFN